MLLITSMNGRLTPQSDEGTEAHLFQLWLLTEVIVVGFFAAKWFTKAPKQAAMILVFQVLLILAACAPVIYLHL